jgi:hypothetical protein
MSLLMVLMGMGQVQRSSSPWIFGIGVVRDDSDDRARLCFIHISCDSLAFGCSLLLPPPKFGAFGFWDLTPPTLIGTI